ncbi:hypothetical protein EU537_11650 [Candidatus Thorarchaeota archaeon]|nr:MAG: hypothetical protein EU537_11650 [Candidatus Thorarchaeota archaeon]
MNVTHLDLTAEICPDTSHIHVEGDVVFSGFGSRITFILNPSLELIKIEADSNGKQIPLEATEVRPSSDLFVPAAQYEVELSDDLVDEQEIKVHVEYEGRIYRYLFDTSRIRSDFVELAIYAIWYPMVDFSDRPSYILRLHAPSDWIWITNGNQVDERPPTWKAEGHATDITLHGRPKSNAIDSQQSDLFWGEPRNLEQLKPLEKKFKNLQSALVSWLGSPDNESLRIILVPRDFGGGYARKNLIVIQDDVVEELENNEQAIIEYWGHEFAHSWFMKTTVGDYHNWIDEAFATYASLLATEKIYGKTEFDHRIEKYRKRIAEAEDLSSIKSIKRQDPNAQLVYYVYGTLILHAIRELIGREKFIEFMQRFAQKCLEEDNIITDDLIEALETTTGSKWAPFIDEKLSMKPKPL